VADAWPIRSWGTFMENPSSLSVVLLKARNICQSIFLMANLALISPLNAAQLNLRLAHA
jgi:hypothetical protein